MHREHATASSKAKAYMTQLYMNIALSLDQRDGHPRAAERTRVRRKTNLQHISVMSSKEKAYMARLYIDIALSGTSNSECITQLYVSIRLSLDQRGDQPRAAKQKRVRCNANKQQRAAKQNIVRPSCMYIAFSLDQTGDQPRASKRIRIRCKASI